VAVIYLRHPTHGTKVAMMDAEAEADERNGWKRFTPGAPAPAAPVAPELAPEPIVEPPANQLHRARRRRAPEALNGDGARTD